MERPEWTLEERGALVLLKKAQEHMESSERMAKYGWTFEACALLARCMVEIRLDVARRGCLPSAADLDTIAAEQATAEATASPAAPLCCCACHERTQSPRSCFYCANAHTFEGAFWNPPPKAAR